MVTNAKLPLLDLNLFKIDFKKKMNHMTSSTTFVAFLFQITENGF